MHDEDTLRSETTYLGVLQVKEIVFGCGSDQFFGSKLGQIKSAPQMILDRDTEIRHMRDCIAANQEAHHLALFESTQHTCAVIRRDQEALATRRRPFETRPGTSSALVCANAVQTKPRIIKIAKHTNRQNIFDSPDKDHSKAPRNHQSYRRWRLTHRRRPCTWPPFVATPAHRLGLILTRDRIPAPSKHANVHRRTFRHVHRQTHVQLHH